MNRMRQRKVRNDRALAIIRNLAEFQEDDAIKIADGHTKPAAKKVSVFKFLATTTTTNLARFCSNHLCTFISKSWIHLGHHAYMIL